MEASDVRRRQVIDIPPLKLETTERRAGTQECPGCGCCNVAEFPEEAKTSVQYGSRIKALLVYLNQFRKMRGAVSITHQLGRPLRCVMQRLHAPYFWRF